MKKLWKGVLASVMAASVAMSATSMLASAAWEKTSTGAWNWIENGQKATGWKMVNGTWYYMDQNGEMQTGWVFDGKNWYYMQNSGAMTTGWVKTNNQWYYLNNWGGMATGWVKTGDTWYFLQPSGAMATGWVKSGNEWYHMDNSGAMQTGFYEVDGKTYFSSAKGDMQTGVVEVDGKVYYFGEDNDGAMKTGYVNIDGKLYRFDETGECTSSVKPAADVAFNTSDTGSVAPVEPTVPDKPAGGGSVIIPPSDSGTSEPETPVDTSTHVKDEDELLAAIADETVSKITIDNDIVITNTVNVNRTVEIDGAGYTISAEEGALTSSYGKNNVLLLTANNIYLKNMVLDGGLTAENNTSWCSRYTLSAYRVSGIVLEDLTVKGGNTGVLANGSTVTLEGTTTVTGNGLGGIEVSQGSGVTEDAVLNVNGNVVISDESISNPAVRIDCAGVSTGTVNWASHEPYHYTESGKNQYYYFADEANKPSMNDQVEAFLAAAKEYEYSPVYEYNGTFTINGTTISYNCDPKDLIDPSEKDPTPLSADMSRFFGAFYRANAETAGFDKETALTFDGVEYTWDQDGTLKGSNWKDAEGKTLISAIADEVFATNDSTCILTMEYLGVEISVTLIVSDGVFLPTAAEEEEPVAATLPALDENAIMTLPA